MGYTKKDIFSSYKYLKENELRLNANRIIINSGPEGEANRVYFMNMCIGFRENTIKKFNARIEELKLKLQTENLNIDLNSIKSEIEKLSIDEVLKLLEPIKTSIKGKEIDLAKDIKEDDARKNFI